MSGLVKARWVAGYPVVLADGTKLEHGESHRISASEAEQSDNWAVDTAKPEKAKPQSEA